MSDIQLPQYYREVFFSKDTLLRTEVPDGRGSYGMAGDPIPYTMHNDNVITALLLCFFILAIISFANVKEFIVRQAKNFFYLPHEGTTETGETAVEVRFRLFLVVLVSMLFALLYYFYTLQYVGETFVLDSSYLLIAIFFGVFLGYFLLKTLFYIVVNNVFFDGKRNRQWLKSLSFIIAIEVVLSFPAVLGMTYMGFAPADVEIYLAIVLLFVKLLTIYKCFIIFFRRNVIRFQIILYLCALEMIPLIALWEVLAVTANSLKINF